MLKMCPKVEGETQMNIPYLWNQEPVVRDVWLDLSDANTQQGFMKNVLLLL